MMTADVGLPGVEIYTLVVLSLGFKRNYYLTVCYSDIKPFYSVINSIHDLGYISHTSSFILRGIGRGSKGCNKGF